MKLRTAGYTVAGILMGVLMGGCSSTGTDQSGSPAVETKTTVQPIKTEAEAKTQPVPQTVVAEPDPLNDPAGVLANRVIYFDYDSSEVRAEDQALVEAHANYLAQNPGRQVLLEGHADERGSREYNVALGERRALAVGRLMQLLGVSDTQMRTVSYGEENPADDGHDEIAWAANRRVELNYGGSGS